MTDVISLNWERIGESEIGIDASNGNIMVRVDPKYYHPTKVDFLLGEASKAKAKLGWIPNCKLDQVVEKMIQEECKVMKN